MLKFFTKRLERDEEGFTLIELMVVVLIIAILIAIAIPTFLGARRRAQDRAAQSSLRNALTSAKTIFTDAEDYTQATTTAMTSAEPSLTFRNSTTVSANAREVSVNPVSTTEWAAASKSASGTCFYIKDSSTGASAGTRYGSGSGTCDGATAATSATSVTPW